VRIEDSGGNNFPATINTRINNIFGELAYSFTTTKQILPQTIRRIHVPWNGSPSIGLFKVSGTVKFLNQTHTLPTKYVLIVSPTIRLILFAVVIITLAVVLYRRSKAHAKK
jgi:hypothetical protein